MFSHDSNRRIEFANRLRSSRLARSGLKQPSALRCYFVTVRNVEVSEIGRLSDEDWSEVRARLKLALEV